jgi:hypothetical protein
MTTDQQANIAPVGEQAAPMPSANQAPSTPQESGQAAPIQEVSNQTDSSEGLPDDASERTRKNFEHVREQLRQEKERRTYLEGVFNSMQPPAKEETPTPLYDPQTGLLNEGVFTDVQKRAFEAEQRAQRAESAVQSYLRSQEEQAAFTAHPELNPTGKEFDKTLHNLTRSILTDAMLNPGDYGGKQLSFKEAADQAKSVLKGKLEAARTEGAQAALEQLTPKEQAALQATGSPSRRTELQDDLTDLRRKTRKGDTNSVVERLKGVPWK